MTRLSRRGVSLAIVLIASTATIACVETTAEVCADGTLCPSNTSCRALSEPTRMVCVTGPQSAACDGIGDGMECTFDSAPGTCKAGACFPSRCGDGFQDPGEICDDGNKESLDGCSADCRSLEVCGNAHTDLALGEQCDDGLMGLSGDGCSSRCLNEYYLWRDVTLTVPLVRYDQAFVADPSGGVLMFGGTAGTGPTAEPSFPLGDTWRWDGITWSELVSPTGAPSRRARVAAALDSTRAQTLVFGGRDGADTYLDELWAWTGLAWTQLTPVGARPGRRAGAAMACSPARCLLFGGESDAGLLGDTWSWDGTSWTQVVGPSPSPRAGAALVFDTTRSKFVLIGGGPAQDYFEMAGSQWSAMGPLPFPSATPTAGFDPVTSATVVINGSTTWTYTTSWTNTLREFYGSPKLSLFPAQGRAIALSATQNLVSDWTNGFWAQKDVQRPLGNPRGLTATYDPGRGRTIVVDAGGGTQPTATWEWDGALWRRTVQLVPQQHPPAAEGSALVFDANCGEAVAFGGVMGASSFHGETWIYKGTWTRYPGAGPSPRADHAMAYDAKRDAVVMFGGRTPQLSSELWEWRGPCGSRTWTRVMATGPTARSGARMAYDARRGVVVLFGGVGAGADRTWEWNGTTWTEIADTATTPSARFEHGMVYDPRLKGVVVYGGRAGALRKNDGARWNGTTWAPIDAVVSIAGRSAMAIAPDVTGGLLMIGGENSIGPVTEILRLRAETDLEGVEACQLAGADADGDGLAGCADPDCGFRCRPMCPLGEDCIGPHCGDGTCSAVEDYLICPGDCPTP